MIRKYALIKVATAIARETEEFSLRQIAKKAKVSASTAKACLDYLLKNAVVKTRKLGKSHLFRWETNFLAKQLKVLISLAEINASNLTKEILKHNPAISIVLYGSVAKGEDSDKSDVDILIITHTKTAIPELKASLNREITLLVYSYQEWKEKAEKDRAFYNEVILNCISLFGEKPVTQ